MWGRINLKVLPYLFGELTKEQIGKYSQEKEEIYRRLYKQHLAPLKGLLSFLDMLKKEGIDLLYEALIGIKRAGADIIISYGALEILDYLAR